MQVAESEDGRSGVPRSRSTRFDTSCRERGDRESSAAQHGRTLQLQGFTVSHVVHATLLRRDSNHSVLRSASAYFSRKLKTKPRTAPGRSGIIHCRRVELCFRSRVESGDCRHSVQPVSDGSPDPGSEQSSERARIEAARSRPSSRGPSSTDASVARSIRSLLGSATARREFLVRRRFPRVSRCS
jgi:hypothetical protein